MSRCNLIFVHDFYFLSFYFFPVFLLLYCSALIRMIGWIHFARALMIVCGGVLVIQVLCWHTTTTTTTTLTTTATSTTTTTTNGMNQFLTFQMRLWLLCLPLANGMLNSAIGHLRNSCTVSHNLANDKLRLSLSSLSVFFVLFVRRLLRRYRGVTWRRGPMMVMLKMLFRMFQCVTI